MNYTLFKIILITFTYGHSHNTMNHKYIIPYLMKRKKNQQKVKDINCEEKLGIMSTLQKVYCIHNLTI